MQKEAADLVNALLSGLFARPDMLDIEMA